MSDTDNSPETADEASTPPSPPTQQTAGMRPTRGIDPPTSGFGPPPPPDFGIITKPPRAVVDYDAGTMSDQPGIPPQTTSRPWAFAAIIAAIAIVLVLILGLIVFGVGSLLNTIGDPGGAAPSSETDDSGQSDPIQDPVTPGVGSGLVEMSLQAKIDEYKEGRDNGWLWAKIPDTEFNRTAVSAFLYLLLDMKLAASFGGDTTGYLDEANELELKLLNEEPLGSDISIKLSDRTFTYDGETGEGGYTSN